MGKSSLTNALMPGLDVLTGEISENSGLGQHTTTTARLYHFPSGGDLIDSPGSATRPLAPGSRSHHLVFRRVPRLPGRLQVPRLHPQRTIPAAPCTAVERGAISADRFRNYHRILETMQEARHGRQQARL